MPLIKLVSGMQEWLATPDHTPKGRGFDSSFGYFHHANDYFTETAGKCQGCNITDLWNTDSLAHGENGTGPDHYEEGLFKKKLLNVVNNHDPSTPLFLYYAPHNVHGPLQVPDSYLNKINSASLTQKIDNSTMQW